MPTTTSDNLSFQIDEFYLDLQQDGSRLKNLPEEEIAKNPFPGLRPFKTSEMDLFYGRKEQTNELIVKLAATNFLAVIGSSGTGKSSLVRAGLIPALFGGNIPFKGGEWKIAICRPGNDPIKNLSIALSGTMAGSTERAQILLENERIEPLLRGSSYGVLDAKEKIDQQFDKKSEKQNLLIIIDQFEELFRFDRKELKSQNILNRNIESDFVKLLLQCKSDESVFVVITMRSEFLGDCVKFRGLPEAINKSQYLVPQLDREQLTKVIKGPVERARKSISPDLVEMLINEIESEKLKENLDQLPILQHALMRTYDEAFKNNKDCTEMLYSHYEKIGGMKGALAKHAQEVFEKLDETDDKKEKEEGQLSRKQLITKSIFQALTDATSDQKGGRRPTELQNIYKILQTKAIKAKTEEVDEVVNYFRHDDNSFIMPPTNTKLYPGLMLDISHESLMRNWPMLDDWMKEEVIASELYRRLNDNREQNDRDNQTYIGGSLLQDIKDWRDSGFYNAAWAGRYQKTSTSNNKNAQENGLPIKERKTNLYNKNLKYLTACEDQIRAKQQEEKKRIKAEQQQEQLERERNIKTKRNKLIATISIIAALVSIVFGASAYVQSNAAKQATLAKAEAEKAETRARNAKAEADAKAAKANAEAKAAKAELDLRQAQAAADAQAIKIKADADAQTAKANAELKAATDKANAMNDAILKVSGLIRMLTQEDFYQSTTFKIETRNAYLDQLVALKYGKAANEQKFKDLLSDLNNTAVVAEIIPINSNMALLKAKQIYDSSRRAVPDSVLLSVANANYFYSQKLDILHETFVQTKAVSNISAKGNTVVVRDKDTVQIYKVSNTGLSLVNQISLADSGQTSYYDESKEYPAQSLAVTDNGATTLFSNTYKNKSGKIYRINSAGETSSITLANLFHNDSIVKVLDQNHFTSAISENGNTLALDYGNYNALILKLDNPNARPISIKLRPGDSYLDEIYMAKNGMAVITRQKSVYRAFDVSDSDTAAEILKDEIWCANFAGDNIILQLKKDKNIYLYDLKEKTKTVLNLSDPPLTKAEKIILSPDQELLCLKFASEELNIERPMAFFQHSSGYQDIYQKLPQGFYEHEGSTTFLTANNDVVNIEPSIGIDGKKNNQILLSKNFGVVKSGDIAALISKLPPLQLKEQIAIGLKNIDDVMNSLSKSDIADLADYYYKEATSTNDSSNFIISQKLYKKLLNFSNTDKDNALYLDNLRTIAIGMYDIDSNNITYVAQLKELAATTEKMMAKGKDTTLYQQSLSSTYWELSWSQLFIKEFNEAAQSAQKGFNLYPYNNGIKTNEALGYLLTNQCEKAFSIYRSYKGKYYLTSGKAFTQSFLKDFHDLENAGILDPDNKLSAKVKAFLNDETPDLKCN